MTNNPSLPIFAFDVGKGSLGICVRQGLEILELDSKLVDATYPCITANGRGLTSRVRMARTRQFHKARLTWLKRQWEQTGLTALAPNSPAWSVEYQAGKYASGVLLRCALLMGKTAHPDGTPFTDADLFKALYSAVRKRGYGDVVWKTTSNKPKNEEKIKKKESELTQEEKDEKANKERSASYLKEMATYTTEHYFHPCFMEAARLGLWDMGAPTVLQELLENKAGFEPIRGENLVAPRELRRAEFEALFGKIQQVRPQLQAIDVKTWMDGETQTPFISYFAGRRGTAERFKSLSKFRGSNRTYHDPETPFDWQGVFNQKVPRFDNRIIAKCAVFGDYHQFKDGKLVIVKGRNVCREKIKNPTKYEYTLAKDVKMLKALHNLRFPVKIDKAGVEVIDKRQLTHKEFIELWENFKDKQENISSAKLNDYLQIVAPHDFQPFGKKDTKGREEAFEYIAKQAKHNESGRSSFSKPGLAFMKALLLSGEAPPVFIQDCLEIKKAIPSWKSDSAWIPLVDDPKKGITAKELEQLVHVNKQGEVICRLGNTWESITIGDVRNQNFDAVATATREERLERIANLIGQCNNPVVRHRVEWFVRELDKLTNGDPKADKNSQAFKGYGKPDRVILEFIREDFSKEGKKREEARMKALAKKKEQWAKDIVAYGETLTPINITKWRLWEEQHGLCFYTGKRIELHELFDDRKTVEVEHIVPRARGGSDALHNKVIMKQTVYGKSNKDKGTKTPYEWFGHDPTEWRRFSELVESLKRQGFSATKAKILLATTEEDYAKALDKYTGLAETAYIARLVQECTALYYGGALGVAGESRQILVTNGSNTAAFRRDYKLNQLLFEGREAEWEQLRKDTIGDYNEKLRANKKHHALDAFAISLWDEQQKKVFETEAGAKNFAILKRQLEDKLAYILPAPIVRNTTELDFEDTLYGLRVRTNAKGKREYVVVKHVKLSDKNLKDEKLLKISKDLYDETTKGYADYLHEKITHIIEECKALVLAIKQAQKSKNEILENVLNEQYQQARKQLEQIPHPVLKTPIKRVTKRVSVVNEMNVRTFVKPAHQRKGKTIPERLHVHIGEYVNVVEFSKLPAEARIWESYWKKGERLEELCRYAQLKRTKQHKGQLLFYDAKGKVRVRPVYGYESEQKVRQSLKAQGLKLYQNGKLFYSGVIVTISKPIEHCGYTIPANQPFRLTSIKTSGEVKFELANGLKFDGNNNLKTIGLNSLTDNGLLLH